MSSLKKLSDYEPLTTPEVIDGIELYAIVNGKTVRVSKANLFSADRTSVNNIKKELNNTITNQIKTVNTSITNLTTKVNNNRALEDERWAQTLMRGYNKTFTISGTITSDKIERNQTAIKIDGNTNTKFSKVHVHINYPKYKKVEWEDSSHTRTVVNTYASFNNDNTTVIFYRWREKYNGSWTNWQETPYRVDMASVYNANGYNFDVPHAAAWVNHSPDGIGFDYKRWVNDTMVTEIQYVIGIMNYSYFGANSRTDEPTVPTIDTTKTDKHSITTSNGIRW